MNVSTNHGAISTKQLGKLFGRRTVFSRLDLEIAEGESIAIIGPNGAGKTTLLRCLAGILGPSHGAVYWFGQPVAATPALRRLVGMVAHDGFLYPHLTASENLLFAARMYDVVQPDQRTDVLIQTAGLTQYASYPAKKLSRGMRQRLSIVRALVHDPPILILDEPFASLDTAGAEWLKNLLHALRQRNRTICFTTHDWAIAQACADRILMLCSGNLRDLESPEEQYSSCLPFTKAA